MENPWASLRQQCNAHWEAQRLFQVAEWAEFETRLDDEFETLAQRLWSLYSGRPDFGLQLENLIGRVFELYRQRSPRLKDLDRRQDPQWFLESKHIGAVAYVDRFAGSFRGVEGRLDYLKELGVTVLHLMPFFSCPENESDGGYAVSSYRETRPDLGTMADLEHLASVLHEQGITLVADFVFNHTSNEHDWARRARNGDPIFQDYYWLFDSQDQTRAWQSSLRDIFPQVRRGSFTWFEDCQKWVWTTFYSYQWDLNYQNPRVFASMAEEMLQIANRGIGILRLDAVAFTGKELGTTCENLPLAHSLIQAFRSVVKLACPSVLLNSEAIVHPDEIAKYLGPNECQLSYNPLLMAELWEAAATKEVRLLAHSLEKRHALPAGTSWLNYVRGHDDVGWTFADEDAAELGIDGYSHRQFLNHFYTGDFPGSFSRGVAFQHNPDTGDRRICGSTASLAGVERALIEKNDEDLEVAIRRLLLLYTVAFTVGGIPLLYLGDELAFLNDYTYQEDSRFASDSRWVHRPLWDEKRALRRLEPATLEARVFSAFTQLATLRRNHAVFGVHGVTVLPSPHSSVLAFLKKSEQKDNDELVLVIASFSESSVVLSGGLVSQWLGGDGIDLLTGETVSGDFPSVWASCQVRVLVSASR